MTLEFKIQELIHRFEVGPGARLIRAVLIAAAFAGLAVLYDALCFRNLATEEAMNSAQVAGNLAEGKGFTTHAVTPFSMFLVSRHRPDQSALLKAGHPDLANPPLYPLLLAAVLKFIPQQDFIAVKYFSVAHRDLAITLLNQLLLLAGAMLVYRLARKWFDLWVAGMSSVLFVATELFWRFSVSGLSTNFLLLLTLLLVWAVTSIEDANRSPDSGRRVLALAAVLGLVLGAMMLTRYAAGFFVVPVIIFAGLFLAPRRKMVITTVLVVFVAVALPWTVRNLLVSGTPFGTAGFAMMESTRVFPEDRLQHSLHPTLVIPMAEYARKLVLNGRDVVMTDIPRISGNWLSAFFLVGMLVRFRSVTLSRLRWFILIALATLIPVQALGKTQIWADLPEINTENLVVLLSPFVLIYGVGVFFILIESFQLTTPAARWAAWGGFGAVAAIPLVLAFLPPHPTRLVYPPYYPPGVQLIARWMDTNNLIMTDIPSAMGWYGDRQAILTTESWKNEFSEIHDFQKPINALYLTTKTTQHKYLATWMRGDTNGWEGFIINLLIRQEVPTGFPLRRGVQGYLGEGQLLLMDYDRWRRETPAQ